MKDLEKRYAEAIKDIGGAAGILSLPEQVKEILKKTTSLEYKVQMLELIAQERREHHDKRKVGTR